LGRYSVGVGVGDGLRPSRTMSVGVGTRVIVGVPVGGGRVAVDVAGTGVKVRVTVAVGRRKAGLRVGRGRDEPQAESRHAPSANKPHVRVRMKGFFTIISIFSGISILGVVEGCLFMTIRHSSTTQCLYRNTRMIAP
jgi:hypothetical protein